MLAIGVCIAGVSLGDIGVFGDRPLTVGATVLSDRTVSLLDVLRWRAMWRWDIPALILGRGLLANLVFLRWAWVMGRDKTIADGAANIPTPHLPLGILFLSPCIAVVQAALPTMALDGRRRASIRKKWEGLARPAG